VRGQLHKDFIYGKPKLSNEKGIFHIRTKITKLEDHKDLKKVVDTAIKKLIEKHLEINYGIDIHNPLGFLIPKDAFFQNGNWRLFLPNKNGDPVPIKKIRVQETINNAVKLKSSINQWVNPRNNHHVLIYKDVNGYLKADVVTFWTVTERIIQGLNVYKLPDDGNEIVSTIEINDMFLLGLRQEEIISCSNDFSKISNHLFKVQKIAGGENFLEICFRKHVDSRKDSAAKVDYKYIKGFGEGKTGWNSFNPTKVIMDPLGKIISI
jgi:CRISPR-associated endonuclease Csn1